MSYLKLSKNSDKILTSDGIVLSTDNMTKYPFVVYSEDDNSLIFYCDTEIPAEGEQYKGKQASIVYTDMDFMENVTYQGAIPWYSIRADIKSVKIHQTFKNEKPKTMAYWFYGLESCVSMNLNHLDTSEVTSMDELFDGCHSLEKIDVSNFDTSNVTGFRYMFYDCEKITSLDISNMSTSSATSIRNMFAECINLKTIYSDDDVFDVSGIRTFIAEFQNCYSIVGGNGTTFDVNRATGSMAHIDVPDNPGYFTAKGD